MWRSFFLAVGITLCIFGAQCLVLEKAVLANGAGSPPPVEAGIFAQAPIVQAKRDFKPPEWAPWTLLSAGVVLILYSSTLSRNG